MFERFWGYIPTGAVWFSALFSSLIPMIIYFINKKLHEYGDPPWKKDENSKSE